MAKSDDIVLVLEGIQTNLSAEGAALARLLEENEALYQFLNDDLVNSVMLVAEKLGEAIYNIRSAGELYR